MSEANRKVCGEGLSLSLQNRDARVIGKSVSKSEYGSVCIGSVGIRMEKRLARMDERYQHTLPKFLSRFFDAPKRSLWSNSYSSPDVQYLLWNPSMQEEVEEDFQEAPDVWMKSKKPWVGASVFRMPPRAPSTPMQAVRTPKGSYTRTEASRPRALERLRQKNSDHAYRQSTEGQALESLPPFLSSSKTVQKVLRQARGTERQNRFRPQGLGSQFLPQKIQNQLSAKTGGIQQAKGRFRRDQPRGLRSLQLSSPMMQELMPLPSTREEMQEEMVPAVSPWFTRAPARSQEKSSLPKTQQASRPSGVNIESQKERSVVGPRVSLSSEKTKQRAVLSSEKTKQRAVLSSLTRSFRRTSEKNKRPSQRVAQNIDLGMKDSVQETPASVHAMQRSSMNTEKSGRSLLPVSNIFSEQSRIGRSIARHQESFIGEKKIQLGALTASKSERAGSIVSSAQKRQSLRRPQLFSMPELLDIQSGPTAEVTEAVQKKAASPWFSRDSQTANRGRSKRGAGKTQRAERIPNSQDVSAVSQKTAAARVAAKDQAKSAFQSRRDRRIDDVDVFGFGGGSSPRRSTASDYAADRIVEEGGGLLPKVTPQGRTSSYQPIDQRSEERVARREAEGQDRISRMEAPLAHQVRERRFVPTPDFVDIQEAVSSIPEGMEDSVVETKSPWFTRSPVVHAAKRQERIPSNGSIVPKAVASARGEGRRLAAAQRFDSTETVDVASRKDRPVESALDRTPKPSIHNPSRPRMVRNTGAGQVALLRSAGLDAQGVALALAYTQGNRIARKEGFAEKGFSGKGWADVRFRRQSPISYARSSEPETVVVQTGAEEQEGDPQESIETKSPWFTREPAQTAGNERGRAQTAGNERGRVQTAGNERGRAQTAGNERGKAQSMKTEGALGHMLARSTASVSLPEEIVVGTKSRSIFSGQPTVRLSTLPPQTVLRHSQRSDGDGVDGQDAMDAGMSTSSSPWLSPKEGSKENRVANELIKRVAKLGVKAKIYKSPKGTMMDAKAAKALGFTPPKGKSRIPLTWILEAVENKSSSGILPNWAQRASEEPLHKGTSDMVNSLNKASSMNEVLRVIFERTSSKQIAPSFQSLPVHATQILQNIRQEAHQFALAQEQHAQSASPVSSSTAKRRSRQVMSNFTGLKPMATAKIAAEAPEDDKLSRLTRTLQDLILVAEQQGKREAQGGARLAEDSAQAIEEGRGEPKGIDESVSEQLNLDQLYRDVLRSVEDAINLRRVLRFDNDDHFDGGW